MIRNVYDGHEQNVLMQPGMHHHQGSQEVQLARKSTCEAPSKRYPLVMSHTQGRQEESGSISNPFNND